MFGYQIIIEVFESLRRHVIRTFFTGFGILWAMLILVLLQGGGNGFYRGMVEKFDSFSKHLFHISVNPTATEKLKLTENIAEKVAHALPFFECVVPILDAKASLTYKEANQESSIEGVNSHYPSIKNMEFVEGHFFTQRDIEAGLPVCLLSNQTKVQLLGDAPAIGKCIFLHNTAVYIRGVFETADDARQENIALVSSTFFKKLFPNNVETKRIVAMLKPKQNVDAARTKTASYLHRQLQVQDQEALCIHLPSARVIKQFQALFLVIQGFIWFISCCLLLSGVAGVSNMILVVVKERTKELAIRKVLGAGVKDVMLLIVLESMIIHLLAGMIGMGLGISLLKWINRHLLPFMIQYQIAYLELPYTIALVALSILLLASCLAAIIPTKRALQIKPVNALNNE